MIKKSGTRILFIIIFIAIIIIVLYCLKAYIEIDKWWNLVYVSVPPALAAIFGLILFQSYIVEWKENSLQKKEVEVNTIINKNNEINNEKEENRRKEENMLAEKFVKCLTDSEIKILNHYFYNINCENFANVAFYNIQFEKDAVLNKLHVNLINLRIIKNSGGNLPKITSFGEKVVELVLEKSLEKQNK